MPKPTSRLGRAVALCGALALTWTGLGQLAHRVLFPLPPPDPATFPVPGDRFGSTAEGVQQQVTALDADGWVHMRLTLAPGAEGPPLHVHDTFAENFVVEAGTLSIQLADGVTQLGPGESFRIPPGTAHRPFNASDAPVVISAEQAAMPQTFAACLVQLYPVLDAGGPGVVLQMSVIDPICDTHLADVPRPAQAAMRLVLAPAARLAGYVNYDPARSLHPPRTETAAR